MILHLCNDEKVINRMVRMFEQALPGQNRFIVLSAPDAMHKYVKPAPSIIFAKFGSMYFKNSVGNLNQYSHVILHSMDSNKADFAIRSGHSDITWIVWGADLYNAMLKPKGFGLEGRHVFSPRLTTRQKLYRLIDRLVARVAYQKYCKALRYISAVSAVECDFNLLCKYYPESRSLKRREFYYYPVDAMLQGDIARRMCAGNNIIVGNSSSPTGNHVDVFETIRHSIPKNAEVVVPLSYGNKQYRDWVVDYGHEFLGDSFRALTVFMPIEEYNRTLLSCRYFIYGNLRQEAVGNILVAFAIGGTVYLDNRNPLCSFFGGLGLHYKTIDKIKTDGGFVPLTEDEAVDNAAIIKNKFSHDRLINLIKANFGE